MMRFSRRLKRDREHDDVMLDSYYAPKRYLSESMADLLQSLSVSPSIVPLTATTIEPPSRMVLTGETGDEDTSRQSMQQNGKDECGKLELLNGTACTALVPYVSQTPVLRLTPHELYSETVLDRIAKKNAQRMLLNLDEHMNRETKMKTMTGRDDDDDDDDGDDDEPVLADAMAVDAEMLDESFVERTSSFSMDID
eukprot:ANDGO_03538.mRNA.1 hypothetical protein